MPARDPATSPHVPTSPGTNPGHSPNSSSFSSFNTHSPSAQSHGYGTAHERRRTSFSNMLRRVSAQPGPIPGGSGFERAAEEGEGGGSGYHSRRQSSVENGEDHMSVSLKSNSIRDSTNRLASLSFTPAVRQRRPSHGSMASGGDSQFSVHPSTSTSPMASRGHRPIHPSHLNPAIAEGISSESANEDRSGAFSPPRDLVPSSMGNMGRSGLSVMMDREKAHRVAGPASSPSSRISDPDATPTMPVHQLQDDVSENGSKQADEDATPIARKATLVEEGEGGSDSDDPTSGSALRRFLASEVAREDVERASENTPLLGENYSSSKSPSIRHTAGEWGRRAKKITLRDMIRACVEDPVKALPAVVLGLLLNVLDGVSYGMILFPASPVFAGFGSLGVSMFFMSCIVAQLVFSLGGSIFPGGNGSMMIEAVPFFHILISIIQAELGDDAEAIVATTMVAFAFSSILTGLVFFALGAFKLGAMVGYFPRHILVGCIGGVGIFLIETGLEVSRGLKEDGFNYDLPTLKIFFKDLHAILLWTIPLGLAILLRIITHFQHHQLIFPAYFFIIPIIFYIVVAIGGWDFGHLRNTGWVFDVGGDAQAWWKFYTLFDFRKTHWGAFWAAMPTQLALVFFGILHVPLNVPALGVSLCEDNVKLDRELVAHGYSNLVAGLTGTVPNYLTYVNTVLFYRVGGGSRLSGIMLAAATGAIMMVGPTVIGYLPVMVVGALILVLGIDLLIEAVWDTRHKVSKTEYITIWAIAIGMTVWDFVIGLLFGVILACIFFVVQSSRRRAIRAVFSGATAKSTVRRPRSQRAFIQQVGSQTYVMKLQGFLFFGTITTVEDEIRKLLDLAKWQHQPIRFLIIDLHLVHGVDFSSAEAFVRLQRLLSAKDVLLILCGAAPNGPVAPSLQAVGLWADGEGRRVEVFAGLNEALEWTENAYLTAFYENQRAKEEAVVAKTIDFPKIARPPFSLAESFQNSPRRTHLAKAGGDTLPTSRRVVEEIEEADEEPPSQPFPLLLQTLGSYTDEEDSFFSTLVPYFKEVRLEAGTILWTQEERADGLYLIESGSLRATYSFENHLRMMQETMVAGTIAGDLSTLSDTSRNATAVVDRDCILWKLDKEGLARLEQDNADVARRFIKIVLKVVAEEQEVLSSHLIALLS